MKTAGGVAPGKVILIGEHAVVYGHPAVAIPVTSVQVRVEAEFGRGPGVRIESEGLPVIFADAVRRERAVQSVERMVRRIAEVFDEDSEGIILRIASDIPVGCGLGSSAALSVAAIRALCGLFGRQIGVEEVSGLAFEAEKIFHATPSGIDNSVVAHERPIYFTKRRGAKPIEAGPSSFHFLVADSGVFSSTAETVNEVRRRREAERAKFDSLFWEIGAMASVAREVISRSSQAELGMCMNRNHDLLAELGLACPETERLVEAAREAGAAGAKTSGAGKGGSVLVLLGDANEALSTSAALKQAGARDVYETVIEGR